MDGDQAARLGVTAPDRQVEIPPSGDYKDGVDLSITDAAPAEESPRGEAPQAPADVSPAPPHAPSESAPTNAVLPVPAVPAPPVGAAPRGPAGAQGGSVDGEKEALRLQSVLTGRGVTGAGVTAASGEYGIRLEIHFLPDSAETVPSESGFIERLARILGRSDTRKVDIIGHTALAKTAQGRQTLSEERALAVADLLVKYGLTSVQNISVKGVGADTQAAVDSDSAGMALNRRVEVTIHIAGAEAEKIR